MPPVSAPADKRFRRAQVKPAGRSKGRGRRAWTAVRVVLVLALVAYAGWRGHAVVSSSPLLRVTDISVAGNHRLATGEVMAILEGLRGQNILGVDLVEWQERLLSSPWVEEATLRRELPSSIAVRVRERRPMAIGRIGSSLYLVDATGVVVDEYGPAYADFDLPIVDGLAARGKASGKTARASAKVGAKSGANSRRRGAEPAADASGDGTVDPARAALAARVIAAMTAQPSLADKVSQIDVSDVHDAVVMLEGDPTLLRLGEDQFAERLQQYLDLSDALRERVSVIDYVDLRFPERLYVRPAKGAAVAPAAGAAAR